MPIGVHAMESSSKGPGSLIGATLGGYEVVALIGRGAMGTVYLARDVKLNRRVALKVLLGSLSRTQSLVEQFHKEAQAAAPLNHPGIVRVYSAGTEGGIPFIVMEYVEGEPLDRFLQRKGTIKWDVALHICLKLAQALESAHNSGIVHRDIKPSNIMLDQHGGVRLMDFGIATLHAEGGGQGGHSFLGTPQYMSPEQARNGEVGPTSDLYSVGVTMYQMIAGEMPFTGESPLALINSICNDEPPRLNTLNAEVPDDVARFVAYLMGKTSRHRPANAKVVHGMAARLLRQKGELNSTSHTITSFIQTEMEVSAFSTVQQKTTKFKPPKTVEERQESRARVHLVSSYLLRATAVMLAGIIAYWIGLNTVPGVEIDATQIVPGVDALNIHKADAGVSIIELNRPQYTVSDLQWLGDAETLWMGLRGQSGSMAQGTVGGLAVDLSEGRGYAVLPPLSPLLTPDVDGVYLSSMKRVDFSSVPESATRSTEFLVCASDPAQNEVVVLSRTWNRAYPDPRVLLRIPREQWVWREKDDVLAAEYGSALLHPEGTSVMYVLYDAEKEYSYLSEQSLETTEHAYRDAGIPRTSQGNHIIPGTVQYTPNGAELLYWRKREGTGAELWKIATEDSEINGIRILSGVVGEDYALSPDGEMLAVQYDDAQGGAPQVVIVQVRTGTIVDRLGEGTVSRHAWHPTEDYLLMQQSLYIDGAIKPQLVAVNVKDTEQRVVVTRREGGVTSAYAISPDGEHLAVVSGGTEFPSVVVLEWDALDLEL